MQRLYGLNESQGRALQHKGSHLLITAGPGTGKTHTLVYRIAELIPSLKSDDKILAITFTNKAARQMKERLLSLGVDMSFLFVGTFHAFCLKLLRDYFEHTALPQNFEVVDPQKIEGFSQETLERISYMKSTQLAIIPDNEFRAYQRYLHENRWIDFDDILKEALLLLEDEDVLNEVSLKYRHILVDEYQDINIVQNALLKKLLYQGALLAAIGDANQSIYGFRGSRVEFFSRFEKDFPGALTMALEENYRSASNLVAAAGQMMGGIQLLARMEAQGKLIVHHAATDRAEADYVARKIEKLVGGLDMRTSHKARYGFGEVAVLYRLNAQGLLIGQMLDHLGVPYQLAHQKKRAELYCDEDALNQNEEEFEFDVQKVSLMSLHAAKGLEFPVVFIVGCEDHLLPLDFLKMKADPKEERRLFYVGMTRAKEELYLTHVRTRYLFGQALLQEPSPFLADIKEELKAYEAVKKSVPKAKPDDRQMKLF
ncbi:MAG: ATP-dependent helicase [Candidatus Omnitrophica bacterium]|nr:ATP-dependent helicase [Candidatus Omnitrophota bacterium]